LPEREARGLARARVSLARGYAVTADCRCASPAVAARVVCGRCLRQDPLVRVLVSSPGLVGHIHPVAPLAIELRRQGHEVRWATGPDGCERVKGAGFDAVRAGLSQAERWARFGQRHLEINELPPQERPDFMFGKLFGDISEVSGVIHGPYRTTNNPTAPAALADLFPLVRSWRPDLVVNDAAEFAAPIAATAIGVPHVTHAFGALVPEVRVRRAGVKSRDVV
jgi:hypothetical protein